MEVKELIYLPYKLCMKPLVFVLISMADFSWGSDTPLSGTFSNANSGYRDYAKSTLPEKFNLIVTVSSQGQQFLLQCFKNDQAGFAISTTYKKPVINANVRAGSNCGEKNYQISLDYEEAYIRSTKGWARLQRGPVYVPIVDKVQKVMPLPSGIARE